MQTNCPNKIDSVGLSSELFLVNKEINIESLRICITRDTHKPKTY